MGKSRLPEIDFVRVWAIVAVVLIHVTSFGVVELAEGSAPQMMFFAVNRASQFAVPLFLLISGLVLFYSYDGRWSGRSAIAFYRKSFFRLLLPYLAWSLFYYFFNQYLSVRELHMDLAQLLRMTLRSDISYHLYFMLIIVQLYALFPLFITIVTKAPSVRPFVAFFGIAVQAGFFMYRYWYGPVPYAERLSPTYLGFFLIGGAMGLYYDSVVKWAQKYVVPLLLAGAAAASLYTGLFFMNRFWNVVPHLAWFELAWVLYVAALGLSLLPVGRIVLRRLPRFFSCLSSVSACSFGIYLIHPALLSAYKAKISFSGSVLMYGMYTLLTFAVVFGGSWLLIYGYRRAVGIARHRWKRSNAHGRRNKDSIPQ